MKRFIIPTWLITLLLGAGALAYVLFVFLPGEKEISAMRLEISERQTDVLKTNPAAGEVEQLQKELQQAQEFHHLFQKNAPSEESVGSVLGEITSHAEATEVAIVKLEPHATIEHNSIAELPATLDCQATFDQFFQFLNRLENLGIPLWIESVHLTSLPNGQIRGELALRIFAVSNDISN